jgi:hypothetical protein
LPATTCNMIPSAATCNAATGATQTGYIQECQTILSTAAAQGVTCP